jgi:hypothetical protein
MAGFVLAVSSIGQSWEDRMKKIATIIRAPATGTANARFRPTEA